MSNSREPLGQVAVPVGALLSVLVAFGVKLTDDQISTVLTLIVSCAPLAGSLTVWLAGRSKVTPVNSPQDAIGNPLTAG